MLFIAGCSSPPQQIDFHKIQLPKTPNYYLVCPKDYCNDKQNQLSPIFSVSVNQLNKAWQQMIAKHHIKPVAQDLQTFQYTYIQRTRWLRFPDTINVKLIPISNTQSTIAIYSKSKYGYGDMGVNKKRVKAWLQQLSINLDIA